MTAPVPNYVHRARLADQFEIPKTATPVHDGDTFYLVLDLGTYAAVRITPVVMVRLSGIDTWELSDPRGLDAKIAAQGHLQSGLPITCATERPIVTKPGSTFARTVARVWIGDDDLADLLRAGGHAKDVEHLGASQVEFLFGTDVRPVAEDGDPE